MGLVWVTGVSGTGKSSVCEALTRRGRRAHDADSEGFNHWVRRDTGDVVTEAPTLAPPGWLARYAWRIRPDRVAALVAASGASVTFLCGSVENEVEVWDCFDQVICLVADDDTIRQRLASRTTNDFGKQPDQLAAVLHWNLTIEQLYRALGASIVDATRPLPAVVDDVVRIAEQEHRR